MAVPVERKCLGEVWPEEVLQIIIIIFVIIITIVILLIIVITIIITSPCHYYQVVCLSWLQKTRTWNWKGERWGQDHYHHHHHRRRRRQHHHHHHNPYLSSYPCKGEDAAVGPTGVGPAARVDRKVFHRTVIIPIVIYIFIYILSYLSYIIIYYHHRPSSLSWDLKY